MMCVTSLVTASKERQTGAKSCKAGKHSADEIISFTLPRGAGKCFAALGGLNRLGPSFAAGIPRL
jgi:hypothetical protein